MENIYETLQNCFISIRFLHAEFCPINEKFDVDKSNIKFIRKELLNFETVDHSFLVYCIDMLLEIIDENDQKKIFDFADLIHNMPEIYLGKRNIKSFKNEIRIFNKKYKTKYFNEYIKLFPRKIV